MAYPELQPALFSFNSPLGMCPECNGIGSQLSMDIDKLIPDKNLSIRQGAIIPWRNYFNKKRRQPPFCPIQILSKFMKSVRLMNLFFLPCHLFKANPFRKL